MDDKTMMGRALLIVDTVASDGPALSLAELSTRCGLPKPTVRRIAEDLVRRHVLVREETGYGLGPRLPWLAQRYERQRRIATVRPVLTELQAQYGGYVWLSSGSQQSEFVPAGVVGGTGEHDRPTVRWPQGRTADTLVNTAAGRVLLAQRPEMFEQVVRSGWRPATSLSPTTPKQLANTVRQARDLGAALETDQCMLGWRCVAVAVAGSDGHSAVLGITTPARAGDPARLVRRTLETRDLVAGLV